jgi:hypothetical protein
VLLATTLIGPVARMSRAISGKEGAMYLRKCHSWIAIPHVAAAHAGYCSPPPLSSIRISNSQSK